MFRRFVLAAVSALACLASGVRAAAPAEGEWPLPETYFPQLKALLESAVRQSPRMLTSNLQEILAENGRTIADATRLPNVGGYYRYMPWDRDYRRGDPRSPYTSERSTYGINITQPLYHWGALEDARRIADLQAKIARGNTAEAYAALASELRAQFLQLVTKKAALAGARANQEFVAQQLAVARDRFERKEISNADLTAQTLGAEQAQLVLDRNVADYEWSKRAVEHLAGVAPLSEEQVPDAIPALAVPLDRCESLLAGFAAEGSAGSPALAELRDQIEIEKRNYHIAKTRLRPNLNLLVGSSQDQQSYTANIGQVYGVTSFYAGVQVDWSIFDGFATKGHKANALARRRELERSYQRLSGDVIAAAQEQFRQLQFSARALDLAERQLRLSEDNVKTVQDNASRGFAAKPDLHAAEVARDAARIAAYNARVDAFTRTADFLATLQKDPVLANVSASQP
ncbi:MAG TPA: TolC family protein [Opitutus sp.]|nr:TolC family protein [Opitutus sp.]